MPVLDAFKAALAEVFLDITREIDVRLMQEVEEVEEVEETRLIDMVEVEVEEVMGAGDAAAERRKRMKSFFRSSIKYTKGKSKA